MPHCQGEAYRVVVGEAEFTNVACENRVAENAGQMLYGGRSQPASLQTQLLHDTAQQSIRPAHFPEAHQLSRRASESFRISFSDKRFPSSSTAASEGSLSRRDLVMSALRVATCPIEERRCFRAAI